MKHEEVYESMKINKDEQIKILQERMESNKESQEEFHQKFSRMTVDYENQIKKY